MTRQVRTLALIPARAGSKGIPGKNLRELAGLPLVGHAVACARRVPAIDRIVVSTDDEAIAEAGRAFGAEVPSLRPAHLAQDDTPMLAVVQHVARTLAEEGWPPDIVVLLQPTAPFRRHADVAQALEILGQDPSADSIVSVEPVPAHMSPYYVLRLEEGRLAPFLPEGASVTRRQDAPKAYHRNGQFYISRTRAIEAGSLYGNACLPFITNHRAVNLDTPEDWEEAVALADQLDSTSP